MAIKCYTCQKEIVFDKTILSKTGKQIPLWPDKQNTHGHDEDGNATRGPLPEFTSAGPVERPQQQKSDWNTTSTEKLKPPTQWSTDTTKQQSSQSQGGSYLDTKRLRVMVEELTKKVSEIERTLESHVMIDSNRYENQMQIIYDKLGPLMDSTLTAAEMYKQKQEKQQQKQPEVKGWNSVPNSAPTKFVVESEHDFPVEQTLTDDDDDVNDDNENNNKGVTEED